MCGAGLLALMLAAQAGCGRKNETAQKHRAPETPPLSSQPPSLEAEQPFTPAGGASENAEPAPAEPVLEKDAPPGPQPADPETLEPGMTVEEVINAAPVPVVQPDERGVWQRALALTIDAAFMRPPVSEPLAGAKDTVLSVSVVEASGAAKWLDAEDLKRIGGGLDQFLPATAALAGKMLEKTPPRFERDRDGVIRYGVIEGESPFVASVVLAPGFLALFRDTIGPSLEVVIPSRNKVFVFPPGEAPEHEEMLWREFRSALEPVSLEVFEITRSGIRAAGTLRP